MKDENLAGDLPGFRIVAVPDYVHKEIEARLDAAIRECPGAEDHREHLRQQMLNYVDCHGSIPHFSIIKSET